MIPLIVKPVINWAQEIYHTIVIFYKLSPKYHFVGCYLRAKYPTIYS